MPKTALPPPISMAWLTRLPSPKSEAPESSVSDFTRVHPAQAGSPSQRLPTAIRARQNTPSPNETAHSTADTSPPAIDEADRTLIDPESLIRAAMVLDILSSKTSRLPSGPAILDELSGSLIEVARACQLEDHSAEDLLEAVRAEAGTERELLSRSIQLSQNKMTTSHDDTARWKPTDVQYALRQIETVARLVIREATLVLDAESLVDYRKV